MDTFDATAKFVARSGVVASEIDGEVVMMSPDHGRYYGLCDVAARIWSLLQSPIALQDIVAGVVADYDVAPDVCEPDVRRFLGELIDHGVAVRSA